ncbi:hypothetical protein RRF57_010398 [Xylaria bambusicola]|uniref:Uncharacterized protein n=1 Tax=Xylaria bambusicola TaxID=326684 RepID=A0AAN7Z2P7_9PEZI
MRGVVGIKVVKLAAWQYAAEMGIKGILSTFAIQDLDSSTNYGSLIGKKNSSAEAKLNAVHWVTHKPE